MKMIKLFPWCFLLLFLMSCQNKSKSNDLLRKKIEQIVSSKKAVVGVSIIGMEANDTLSWQGDRHFPLQSVFKMHLALVVLAQIKEGKLALDQNISISKEELLPNLWSPLREENPNGGTFSIARLIQYAVSQSDNVSCDVLIRLVGGPKAIEDFFKKHGIQDIAIQLNEETMQSKWENMFLNWTSPKAASQSLALFYQQKNLLSSTGYDFFWQTMKETQTGANRIKGLLPKGTVVAHKTGTSGANDKGLIAATNDIGIVFLPNGQYFILSVFVADSKEDEATNERIIAEIAKAAYEHYAEK